MNKKFLKLLTFILTCAFLISIATSVSASNSKALPSLSVTVVNPICKDQTSVQSKTFNTTEAITTLSSEQDFSKYTDNKTELASIVRNSMGNHENSFKVYYVSETELTQSDFNTLLSDLIELSFEETDSPTQGDYLRYSWQSYGGGASGIVLDNVYYYDITFNFNYFTTKEQEAELTTAINNLISSFQFDENTSNKKKIDTIHSYITSNITYDYDNLNREDYYLHYTAYAALVQKKAVCEGYAVLFYRLAETCGVDARVITGYATHNNEAHAWNIVKLGNSYYYLDSTWDAGVSEYGYYLKGSTDFLGHTNDPKFETNQFKTKYHIPLTGLENENITVSEADFQYNVIAGNAYVTQYTGTATNVVVPSTLGDFPVIQIEPHAFYNNTTMKTLTLSEGITTLANEAILNCSELETINYPSTLSMDFSGNTGLSSLPMYCYKLKNINVAEGNKYMKDVDGILYTADMKTVVQCPPAYTNSSVTIPNGVETIAPCAFQDCINIKKVIMPNTVKVICHWAFNWANNLTEINISENCESIYPFAFANTGLKEISIPAATINIENSAFGMGCYLEKITVDSDNPVYYVENGVLRSDTVLNKYLYGRNESSYIIPEGIESIGQYAFENATNLKSITLPTTLDSIWPGAFQGCTGLTHVTIPDGTTSIMDYAFGNCDMLASIIIPESVTTIDVDLLLDNDGCTIYGETNSTANQYAIDNNINFKHIDNFKCLEGHKFEQIIYFQDTLNKQYRYECSVCGDKSKLFTESYASIYNTNIELEYTSAEYTGKEIKPKIKKVTYYDKVLVEGVDYKIDKYENNINTGYGFIYISGIGKFKEQIPIAFEITPADISKFNPVLEYTSTTYDEWPKCPTVQIAGLTPFTDFDYEYSNNVNVGTATVTIIGMGNYTGTITKTFVIKPNLTAPATLKLSLSDGHDDVKVTWSKVPNATGYYVYYRKSTSSSYTYLGKTTKTTYTKTSLLDGTKYYFKVIPYTVIGSKTYTTSGSYKTASIYTLRNLSAPSKVTLSLYGYDDVKVTWSKVPNATGYYVYYRKSTSSAYTYLTKTTKTSYSKANLTDGTKYYFKIVPYYVVNSKTYKDDSYKTNSIYTLKKVSTPSVKKYNNSKATVSWSNINGESGYEISVSTSKTGTNIVSKYATTTGKTKTLSVKKGKTYYYKVRAYKLVNNKKIYAPWSNVKSFKLK